VTASSSQQQPAALSTSSNMRATGLTQALWLLLYQRAQAADSYFGCHSLVRRTAPDTHLVAFGLQRILLFVIWLVFSCCWEQPAYTCQGSTQLWHWQPVRLWRALPCCAVLR